MCRLRIDTEVLSRKKTRRTMHEYQQYTKGYVVFGENSRHGMNATGDLSECLRKAFGVLDEHAVLNDFEVDDG